MSITESDGSSNPTFQLEIGGNEYELKLPGNTQSEAMLNKTLIAMPSPAPTASYQHGNTKYALHPCTIVQDTSGAMGAAPQLKAEILKQLRDSIPATPSVDASSILEALVGGAASSSQHHVPKPAPAPAPAPAKPQYIAVSLAPLQATPEPQATVAHPSPSPSPQAEPQLKQRPRRPSHPPPPPPQVPTPVQLQPQPQLWPPLQQQLPFQAQPQLTPQAQLQPQLQQELQTAAWQQLLSQIQLSKLSLSADQVFSRGLFRGLVSGRSLCVLAR